MEPKEKQQNSILIVDDNKENLKMVSNFLKAEGYQIALSLNAADGLQIMEENEIDLILLDVMMPETDGYTFCRQIKAIDRFKDIPVVFLTAKTETSDLVEGFSAGGVDYITKPFHKAELMVRVHNHLELANARKRIEAQAEQILKINRTKDRLYSVIAHDIKSPFANISMLISTIAEGYLEPGTEEFNEILYSINNSTKETYSLLENLLQWTRSQTGDIDLVYETILIGDLVNNACRFLLINATKKNIEISQDLEAGILVHADKLTMQSVIQNLLTNAIKFTGEGGKIHVSVKQQNGKVVVSVEDNGVGMDAEMLEKLFVDGQHFTTQGTFNERGSGLGLLLVKEFVQRNHGEVTVNSTRGVGTTFSIILPLKS